jgi:hypothetical protein
MLAFSGLCGNSGPRTHRLTVEEKGCASFGCAAFHGSFLVFWLTAKLDPSGMMEVLTGALPWDHG